MLRNFGCACWPNLRPYNNRKLQFRSKQCVFLGYSNLHKGFKCLYVAEGRVYISKDVVFDEDVYPFASLHPNAGPRLRAEILLLPSTLLNPSTFADDNTIHPAGNGSLHTNPSREHAEIHRASDGTGLMAKFHRSQQESSKEVDVQNLQGAALIPFGLLAHVGQGTVNTREQYRGTVASPSWPLGAAPPI
jgi:hypothetical protein